MKTVIYHGNCPDGAGSCYVAKKHFGQTNNDVKYIPGYFGEPIPEEAFKAEEVYIIDFSYKRDLLVDLAVKVPFLKVLDHHQTAQADLEDLDFCEFDMNRSGTMMAWDYFNPNQEAPHFIKLIQDRDLWKKELEGTDSFYAWMVESGLDPDILFTMEDEENFKAAMKIGKQYEEHNQLLIERISGMAGQGSLKGMATIIPIVNSCILFSDIAGHLAKDKPFAVCWRQSAKGGISYSLRSNEAFDGALDVSEIAKKFGGGGHKHAAGFETDEIAHAF